MPTPVETLWSLVDSKRYGEVKTHIQAHEEANLIKAIEPDIEEMLPAYLLYMTSNTKDAKPRDLLHFVLTHPQMDWAFANSIKQTTVYALLDAAVKDGDLSVIESLKDVGGFVYNGTLAYEIAADRLKELERTFAWHIQKDKPKRETEEAEARRDRCQKALNLIRDITILYAIKTDNVDLMERLDNAGGEPLRPLRALGKTIIPSFIIGVEQPNPKLKVWKDAKLTRDIAAASAVVNVALERLARHDFFVEQQRRLEAEQAAVTIEILEQAARERTARMEAALASINEPAGCQCTIS